MQQFFENPEQRSLISFADWQSTFWLLWKFPHDTSGVSTVTINPTYCSVMIVAGTYTIMFHRVDSCDDMPSTHKNASVTFIWTQCFKFYVRYCRCASIKWLASSTKQTVCPCPDSNPDQHMPLNFSAANTLPTTSSRRLRSLSLGTIKAMVRHLLEFSLRRSFPANSPVLPFSHFCSLKPLLVSSCTVEWS